jgi:hypothetical protein
LKRQIAGGRQRLDFLDLNDEKIIAHPLQLGESGVVQYASLNTLCSELALRRAGSAKP